MMKKRQPLTAWHILLLAGLLLTTAAQGQAQQLNVIPTSANHLFVMERGVLHGSRANFGADHHIDWMTNGDYATYELDNTVDAQYYTIAFTAGTTQPSVTLNFSIKSASGTTVCDRDISIQINGDWSSTARSYDFRTQAMAIGLYTKTITFRSVGGVTPSPCGLSKSLANDSQKERDGQTFSRLFCLAILKKTGGELQRSPPKYLIIFT